MKMSSRPRAARRIQSKRMAERLLVSRRNTSERLEQQADDVARRFSRGETGLGARIVPTASASFRLPASAGNPLPGTLRERLEHSFDSGLGAIRIHRDANADESARHLQARAFTGGAHIYFRTGAFDTASVTGLELIAHEVTHVLQQTGRASADHALVATSHMGTGFVQCQSEESDKAESQESVETQERRFQALIGAHRRGAAGVDADLEGVAQDLRAATEGRIGRGTRPATANGLAADVAAGKYDEKSIRARSLLCDALKILGFHEEALHLINTDAEFKLVTADEDRKFFDFLRARPQVQDWLARVFYVRKELKRFWPDGFVAAFRSFLFRPHESAAPNATLVKALEDKQTEWMRATLSDDGDRVRNAWRFLVDLDTKRVEACDVLEREQRQQDPGASPTRARLQVAREMQRRFEAVVQNPAEAPFTRDLAGRVARVAANAGQILASGLQAFDTAAAQLLTTSDVDLLDEDAAQRTAHKIDHPLATELEALLVAWLPKTLPSAPTEKDTDPAFPSSDDYAARLRDYVGALTQTTRPAANGAATLPVRLGRELARVAGSDDPNMPLLEGLTFLLVVVEGLVRLLQDYSPARDDLTPHFADERQQHAVRLARTHAFIGAQLGWLDLMRVARPYLLTPKAHLYIAGEWEVSDAPPGRMEEDFPSQANQPVIEGLPLTLHHLVRWFRLGRRAREKAALLTLLAGENAPTGSTEIPWREKMADVTQHPEDIRAQLRTGEQSYEDAAAGLEQSTFGLDDPQRFVVRDYDLTGTPETGWSDIIHDHEKTLRSLIYAMPEFGVWIFPEQPSGELVGWITPSILPLAAFLATSKVIAERLGGIAADPTSFAWLDQIAGEDLNALIDRAIGTELDPLEAEIPMLWRRLTTYRRRVLAMQWGEKLQSVIDDRPRAADPRYLWPGQAAAAVAEFDYSVAPREEPNDDTDIQSALLTIALAPQLSQLFTSTYPYEDAAQQLYQFVLLGLRVLRDATQEERVLAIAHPDESLRGLYDDSVLNGRATAQLESARIAMEQRASDVRGSRGFQVTEERKALLPEGRATAIHVGRSNFWVRNERLLPNGDVDPESGERYYIVEIYETFSYYPPYGSPTPGGMRRGAAGVYSPPLLTIDGEQIDLSTPEAVEKAKERQLLLLSINGHDVPVSAGDVDNLNFINDMVLWRSVQISMESLAAITEAYVQAMIAGVEFAFPEVAYAELVLNVTQFVLSDEFQELVRQFKDDPQAMLERVMELVRGRYLTADAIWRFILLGGQHPLFQLKAMRAARQRLRTSASGKLARVLRGLSTLSTRIHNALERLREYSRPPLRAVQGNLMQRPRLTWVLHRALMLAELVGDLLPSDLSFHPEDFTEIPQDVSANLQRLVEGLARLELPDKIFDNAVAISLIAEFLLSRMGFRGKALAFVLQNTPVMVRKNDNTLQQHSLMDEISGIIAEGLDRTPIDPNNLWRELLPNLQERFNTARDELVDGIIEHVNAFFEQINPMLPDDSRFASVSRPTDLTKMEIIPTDLDDEADLHRAPRLESPIATPPLERAGGMPLSSGERNFFETRFNRDLSHVRLHTGSGGRAATAPLQADALTSGSHVYLNPKVSAGSLHGRRVLAHELTHVVQQTDPGRPGFAVQPRRGRPGRGVRTSRNAEAAADRAASAVMASRAVDAPDMQHARDVGVQPAVSAEVLDKIVRELSKVSGPGDFEKTPTAGAQRVPGIATARAIWQSARNAIAEARAEANFAAFMRTPAEVIDLVITQITREAASRIDPHIPGIAQLAQRPLPGKRPDSGPTTELNPERFVTLLESFIFATRGIALQLTLSANQKITRVRFTNVHLAWVGGHHRLWDIAFERSYPTMQPAERAALQREVRELLNVLGPQPFIWATREFALSSSFKKRLEEDREARKRGADSVPEKSEYLKTDGTRADNLSVSTHGDLTKRGIGAFHRESHHTTQYLLAEFFGNGSHANMGAFPPKLRSVLPGGVAFDTDGSVNYISSGSNTLDIRQLDPDSGRGSNMPAILLAATTHQKGDLHVIPESDWRIGPGGEREEHGSRTQSMAMRNQFNNALETVGLGMRDDSQATRTRIRTAVQADSARVEREIYSAAVASYHWMHRRMIGQLEQGLKVNELAYYRSIAARHAENLESPQSDKLKAAYDLKAEDLDVVWRTAKKNNDRVMSAAGWPNAS